jgi:hypothetical protein
MASAFQKAFQNLIQLCEELEQDYCINYMVVGGILTPVYAESRFTQDIDMVAKIDFNKNSKGILLKVLKKHEFLPFTTWDDVFYQWTSSHFIQFLDPSGMVKIDFSIWSGVLSSKNIYEKLKIMTFPNRIRIKMFGTECWVQTKENFILSKLIFGGYQDYKDALACKIRFENTLNLESLKENAKILMCENVLNALLCNTDVDDVFPDD